MNVNILSLYQCKRSGVGWGNKVCGCIGHGTPPPSRLIDFVVKCKLWVSITLVRFISRVGKGLQNFKLPNFARGPLTAKLPTCTMLDCSTFLHNIEKKCKLIRLIYILFQSRCTVCIFNLRENKRNLEIPHHNHVANKTVGLSSCGTIDLSDSKAVGLLSCRTIGLSEYWTVGLSRVELLSCRTIELSDYRAVGLLSCRTIELSDYWAVGLQSCSNTYIKLCDDYILIKT